MAISFTQEDGTAVCSAAAYCSGASLNTDTETAVCVEGGTAGTSERTLVIDAGASQLAGVWFEIDPDDSYSWDAGDYTVRLNMTTTVMGQTWEDTYICRVNSSCVNQETIGSLTGQGTNIATTGVYTHTVSGSAVTPDAGDHIIIILTFSNGSGVMDATVGFTPDQDIDTPLTAGAAGSLVIPRKPMQSLIVR